MNSSTATEEPARRPMQRPGWLVRRVRDIRPDPPVAGERWLRPVERVFQRLNGLLRDAVPSELNPFTQMGAVANVTFVVAIVSGVALLFWYSPSVHEAYASVERMHESPFLAELMRSLHRYSSDACMLFVMLHGLHALGARRFAGARWLGWVSGILLIGLLWLVGWTGYWLVWDEAASQVALATARVVDVIPIFPDPITRSFLTDEGVNSLLFFIVFFVHMMIPLAMGILLWVHIMRLNKARFLTGRAMTLLILGVLVGVSLAIPASSLEAASMATIPQSAPIDWYYLLPIVFTDRLSGGLVWLIALAAGVALASIPWTLARRRPEPAVVDPAKCNGCSLCFNDCPYNAITMLPDAEGRGKKKPLTAYIDPAKCVGCGICVGSCDPAGISQDRFSPLDVRRWINQRAGETISSSPAAAFRTESGDGSCVEPEIGGHDRPLVAFVCAQSAGASFEVDDDGVCKDLPGYRVVPVPCIGWVHPLLIERTLRRGSEGVLLIACDAEPNCRLGPEWTAARLEASREPALRHDHVDRDRVRLIRHDVVAPGDAIRAAASFRNDTLGTSADRSSASRRLRHSPTETRQRLGGYGRAAAQVVRRYGPRYLKRSGYAALVVLVLAALTVLPTRLPYAPPNADRSELTVSFKMAGRVISTARPADDTDLLPHMRRTESVDRERLPVHMTVRVDGRTLVDRAYAPGGLFDDGASLAMERIDVDSGMHAISIEIDDGGTQPFVLERQIDFASGRKRVVLFDREAGFTVY